MRYIHVELPGEWSELYVHPWSDLHVGDPLFAESFFIARREVEENSIILLGGDILNCATKTSVSDIYEEAMNPGQALKHAKKLLSPVKEKIQAAVGGNHEYRITKDTSIDVAEKLAEDLEAEYSRESILLKVRFGKGKNGKKMAYTIFTIHGWTGSRFIGGKALNLHRLSDIVLADVYIMGHTHQIQTFRDKIIEPDTRNNNLIERERVYVNTGAWLNYGGYAEGKGYRPTQMGSPIIILDGREKRIEVKT